MIKQKICYLERTKNKDFIKNMEKNCMFFKNYKSVLHNFIQLSLNSDSAQVQILMVRIFDNGPGWK